MTKTKYKHIFFVEKDEQLDDDFCADQDGYVWYDEVEQLGVHKIFVNIEDAKYDLDRYVDFLNSNFRGIIDGP